MGPKQIFRAVAVIALAAVSSSARADAPPPVTVVELDGRRASRIRVTLRTPPDDETEDSEGSEGSEPPGDGPDTGSRTGTAPMGESPA